MQSDEDENAMSCSPSAVLRSVIILCAVSNHLVSAFLWAWWRTVRVSSAMVHSAAIIHREFVDLQLLLPFPLFFLSCTASVAIEKLQLTVAALRNTSSVVFPGTMRND